MLMKISIQTTAACLAAGVFSLAAPHAQGTILRPDKVVVVILQDRASDAIGHARWDYLNNTLAASGLVYTNSHGVTRYTTPNSLALFAGDTLGEEDGNGWTSTIDWEPPTLATTLAGEGFTFSGYTESLPADGSQVSQAGPSDFPDLYTRNLNAMAMITTRDGNNQPVANPQVNKTFGAFQSITDYANLPTVSYVIPNNLHNTHGTNDSDSPYPKAGSADETNNDILRGAADDWLEAELDGYLQWAKTHNSLLIVTQDEERWTGGTSSTITTIVNGDDDLFVAGTNDLYFNHYNLLRTLTDMYGADPVGVTDEYSPLTVDASGKLTVPEPAALSLLAVGAMLVGRRKRTEAAA